ncbi:MAG TPA: alpha/beta hydrolase [Vicinamibacteria bacterium]|nr:alpha/beta hydrolase [Vicinamibacteria bacterium]
MLETSVASLSNGRRLRYACLGRGGTPVVLLHGYPENLQIYCRLAPLLAREREVLAFDWPGLGASEPWGTGASPVQMAKRLIKVLDHFELDRVNLFGADMGGQPALVAASCFHDRIASVIVSNSLVLWNERTSPEIRLLRRRGWNRLLIEEVPWLVFGRAKSSFLERGTRLSAEVEADFWEFFRQGPVRRFLSKMCAGYQGLLPHLPGYYEKIRCPTLILWGERERHFPLAHAERLHELVPSSELVVVSGGEHWMAWQRADDLAEIVCRFLSGLVPSSSGFGCPSGMP